MRKSIAPAFAGTAMLLAAPAWAETTSTVSEVTAEPETTTPKASDAAIVPGESADDDGSLSDIIVTARRRNEPLQATPLAISAIGPARLVEAHVTNISELSTLAPSLNLVRNATNPSSLFTFIRGFGSKSSDPAVEPSVAITIDGVYQSAVIGSFINLFDVEAVEVLRGPQGTLLGKNAPAGGLSIRSRRPGDDYGGFLQVDYGSYGDFQIKAYVDAPIVRDKLSATISYFRQRSDGYIRSTVTGDRIGGVYSQTFRGAFLATPSDNVKWYVSAQVDIDKGEDQSVRNISTTMPLVVPTANYSAVAAPVTRTCTTASTSALCGTVFPNNRRYTTNGAPLPRRDALNYGITSNLDVDAGPLTFTAVTGYRKFEEDNFANIAGGPINVFVSHFTGQFRQFSQELRIASSEGGGLDMDGKLNWLLGAYYFNFDYTRPNDSVVLNADSPNYQQGITNSYALFAHAEYALTDKLGISGGVRRTWDRKTHQSISTGAASVCPDINVPCFGRVKPTGYQANDRASWRNLSFDATVNYRFTPDKMIFIRFAQGYRGGGFNGIPSSLAANTQFDLETVDAFELGSKTDFFNHRLRVNISAFFNKYNDLQRTITESLAVAPFFVQRPQNIAKAETKGIEVEVQARPVEALTLRGSVGYLDAKYTSFFANLTGVLANGATDNTALRFPYTSKWTASAGFTYEFDLGDLGTLAAVGDYSYRGRLNYTDLNYAFGEQKAYGLASATLSWKDASDHFNAAVYVKNLFDKKYFDGGDAIGGVSTYVTDAPPRTVGASLGFKF